MSAPLKIVNLGLPKSGTTTLGMALRKAKLKVADWKVTDERIGEPSFVGHLMYEGYYRTGDPLAFMPEYDAFSEIDIVRQKMNYWPQTDWGLIAAIRQHHPGARFLLTTRDARKVSESMHAWSNLGTHRLPTNWIPGLPVPYGGTDDERIRWIEGHYAFCRQVFRDADDFLEVNVADDDARDKIAAFIGVELPWWGVANARESGEDVI